MSDPRIDVVRLPVGDAALEQELVGFFEACPRSTVQQTPAWRDLITRIDADEPLFLGCRIQGSLVAVLPAYRFEGPLGAVLNSVPQVGPLGGVACRSGVDPAPVYRALLLAFLELARETSCATATLISSPLWPDAELYACSQHPDYTLRNQCQVLDLQQELDDAGVPRAASRNLRRNLRTATSGALSIDAEQSASNLAEWYALHVARHREIGATPLPEALFEAALQELVPRDKARFFFVRRNDSGEMAAGGLYVYHGSVIDALMPSMRSRDAELAPNHLLALHSMRWARERGMRWYNWQGSPPHGGVHRFKLQWGSRDREYAFLTWVTGDVEPLLESEVGVLREAYRWHYVLPFDRVGSGAHRTGPSSREAAWQALEPEP